MAATPPTRVSTVPRVSALAAIQFPFQDPDWGMNFLIGAVFQLIPIIGPIALLGWQCEIAQRLVRRHPRPIPKLEFSDLIHHLERGLAPFCVALVLVLPLALLFGLGGFVVAMAVGLSAGAGRPPPPPFHYGHKGVDLLPPETAPPWPVIAGIGAGSIVALVLVVFLSVLMVAALTRAEITGDFFKAMQLGKLWAYGRRTWGRVIVSSFLFFFPALGIIIAGLLLCCVGLYPAQIVLGVGRTHLYWQIYEEHVARGGEAIEPRPAEALPSEQRPGAPPAQAAPGR